MSLAERKQYKFVVLHDTGKYRTHRFFSLRGAQRAAKRLMGPSPKLDPDGYVVNRTTGACLIFMQGEVAYSELFGDSS